MRASQRNEASAQRSHKLLTDSEGLCVKFIMLHNNGKLPFILSFTVGTQRPGDVFSLKLQFVF